MEEFRKKILKVHESRQHRIRNSNGVYQAYKYIRKNKWLNLPRAVTEHEFYTIIRQVNNLLVESLLTGDDIILPYRMGTIELRKYAAKIVFNGDKLVTNLPIDWDRTLKLWAEDEEAFKNRTLIKMEEKEMFKVFYNRKDANYINKSFYSFEVNRDLKRRLKLKIKNKLVDAFKL
jgi:hypothetical protein